MKKALMYLLLPLLISPIVAWPGPIEEAIAKQSFSEFKDIYTQPAVTIGELKNVLTLILKSTELSPENYKYTYSVATTYGGLEKYDQAIEWYRKAADTATTERWDLRKKN